MQHDGRSFPLIAAINNAKAGYKASLGCLAKVKLKLALTKEFKKSEMQGYLVSVPNRSAPHRTGFSGVVFVKPVHLNVKKQVK